MEQQQIWVLHGVAHAAQWPEFGTCECGIEIEKNFRSQRHAMWLTPGASLLYNPCQSIDDWAAGMLIC